MDVVFMKLFDETTETNLPRLNYQAAPRDPVPAR